MWTLRPASLAQYWSRLIWRGRFLGIANIQEFRRRSIVILCLIPLVHSFLIGRCPGNTSKTLGQRIGLSKRLLKFPPELYALVMSSRWRAREKGLSLRTATHSSCKSGFDLPAPSSTGISTCRSEPLDLLPHDFTNKYLGQVPMSNRVLQKLCTGGEVPVSKVAQFSESSYS
jgi:hypothetical protein